MLVRIQSWTVRIGTHMISLLKKWVLLCRKQFEAVRTLWWISHVPITNERFQGQRCYWLQWISSFSAVVWCQLVGAQNRYAHTYVRSVCMNYFVLVIPTSKVPFLHWLQCLVKPTLKWSTQVLQLVVSSSPALPAIFWSSQQLNMKKGLSQRFLWFAPKPTSAPLMNWKNQQWPFSIYRLVPCMHASILQN